MMKTKLSYIFLSLLVFAIVACQQDDELKGNTGYLQFKVEKNTSTIFVPTRATDLPIALQIFSKETGALITETNDWTEWSTKPLELQTGIYVVKAFSKDVDVTTAGFDEPYYAGQTEVTVAPKVNQSVNIECKLANVKVTVSYSDEVKKYFSELNCTVGNGSGELVFGKTETRAGYFVVEDLNVSLALTNTDGNQYTFKSDPITDVKPRTHYRIQYMMKTSGSGDISITLDPATKEYNVTINIPKDKGVAVNAWSTFATVTLPVSEEVTTIACKYRKTGEKEWIPVAENLITVENELMSARIEGLEPNTSYDFYFTVNGMDSEIATVATEEESQLPHAGFEEWNKGKVGTLLGKKDVWMIGTAEEASALNAFWDTGNQGAATLGKTPTTYEENDIHASSEGKRAAKLSSQYVGFGSLGKFAAGNVYVGRYMETYTSPMGARIRFGREFTSRPTQLKGWYKYTRGTNIDYGDHNKDELVQSGGDKCAIYIALTDNEGLVDSDGVKTAYEVNNNDANSPTRYTVDLSENNNDVIAYGSITDEESMGAADWTQFVIDLEYRDLTRTPKYIIVVASASKYGDYFTGSKSSVLLIDDFELVYGKPGAN